MEIGPCTRRAVSSHLLPHQLSGFHELVFYGVLSAPKVRPFRTLLTKKVIFSSFVVSHLLQTTLLVGLQRPQVGDPHSLICCFLQLTSQRVSQLDAASSGAHHSVLSKTAGNSASHESCYSIRLHAGDCVINQGSVLSLSLPIPYNI